MNFMLIFKYIIFVGVRMGWLVVSLCYWSLLKLNKFDVHPPFYFCCWDCGQTGAGLFNCSQIQMLQWFKLGSMKLFPLSHLLVERPSLCLSSQNIMGLNYRKSVYYLFFFKKNRCLLSSGSWKHGKSDFVLRTGIDVYYSFSVPCFVLLVLLSIRLL